MSAAEKPVTVLLADDHRLLLNGVLSVSHTKNLIESALARGASAPGKR